MARSSICIASLLLLSILTLSSANAYSYDTKPETNGKLDAKPYYNDQAVKSTENEKSDYVKPETEGNGKFVYGKLPNYEQPKPEEKKEKLNIPSKVDYEKPKYSPEYEQQVKQEEEKDKFVPTKPSYEAPKGIPVQGLVYCKTGLNNNMPLQGAVVKVTCLAVDEKTYRTTQFSVLSKPCNSKGNFYATILSPNYGWKIESCKAYLHYSPLETCRVPTNENNGINGDLLSFTYQTQNHILNVKPVSVGPFYYTPPAQTYNKQPVTNANNGY